MNNSRRKHAHQQGEKTGINLIVALLHSLKEGGAVNTGDQSVDLYCISLIDETSA